jgi:putative nucleotidyltransferase with HDIG domain
MFDDDIAHDASHSTRAQLSEILDEQRVEVANDVVTRLNRRYEMVVSPLIVRTLVHTLAKSVGEGSPDPIVHWSRMVRHGHALPVVLAMVDAACEVAEELAHGLNGDLGTIVVLLEIIKARSRTMPSDERAAIDDRDSSGHEAIQSLLAMLRARDDATCSHSQATGEWGRRIAVRVGLTPATTERIVRAGILHDIGKIRVPDAILFKSGALENDEWEIMKRHAESGAEILSQIPTLAQYAPIVAAHHERFDGRGYPYGLRGDEISLEARVVSVADSFHAMVSDRPYRGAFSYGEAIAVLSEGRGTQWDAAVVDVMIALAAEDRNRSTDANLSALSPSFYADCLPLQHIDDAQAI